MEIGPRIEGGTRKFNSYTEYWWMRKINGKRFLFQRFENEAGVGLRASHYSTRHWLIFPKEN